MSAPTLRVVTRRTSPPGIVCDSGWCERAADGIYVFPAVSRLPIALCDECHEVAVEAYAALVLDQPEHAIRRLA